MPKEKILLAMSGGTDSSVAVLLLQDQGYEVVGVTFRFWEEKEDISYIKDAEYLAGSTGIEHYVLDKRKEFAAEVITYFVDEYLQGRTPVPCVRCNNMMKWKLLYEESERLNIKHIATGHYANLSEQAGKYYITPGIDPDKDQSFFLWGLSQQILEKAVFPLGNYTKSRIREIALQKGFGKVALKKDSMGICFCPHDYRSFLLKQLPANYELIRPGNFVDEKGKFIGRHKGYPFYTVGQRRGLGITTSCPVFVKEIIPTENVVVLTTQDEMYKTTMWLSGWNIHNPDEVFDRQGVIVKIRYKKQADYGFITLEQDGLLKVEFDKPVAAIAPGQAACFYLGKRVVGGGIIERAE
jgi:tRNA-specific 2-thiouridylase